MHPVMHIGFVINQALAVATPGNNRAVRAATSWTTAVSGCWTRTALVSGVHNDHHGAVVQAVTVARHRPQWATASLLAPSSRAGIRGGGQQWVPNRERRKPVHVVCGGCPASVQDRAVAACRRFPNRGQLSRTASDPCGRAPPWLVGRPGLNRLCLVVRGARSGAAASSDWVAICVIGPSDHCRSLGEQATPSPLAVHHQRRTRQTPPPMSQELAATSY